MRITNGIVTNNYLKNLNSNMKLLDKYQTQMATGSRLTKLSDPLVPESDREPRSKKKTWGDYSDKNNK